VRVAVYPADQWGCGHHRVIWVAEALKRQDYDVTIVTSQNRHVEMVIDNRVDRVVEVKVPDDVDVVVFQRVTHRYLAQAVAVLRERGTTVVVDVDDDLGAIHPRNPAWEALHPRSQERRLGKDVGLHSWATLGEACRDASLVTATTQALVDRYGHGHGVVLPNYLARHYYDVPHVDSTLLGWPASLRSHPNDPDVVGNAVARLVDQGYKFHVTSVAEGVGRAFRLSSDDVVGRVDQPVALFDWPAELAKLGVGIAPLADTRFNAAKSWLKPLELSAVGVPWVGSPRADYVRLHQLGCGVLVDRPKDWYRVLRSLLTDERRRSELADAGRAVAATLRLEDHAYKWWEAWSDALARDRASRRASVGNSG
jgi:glycosyltransferase involved in cell wall biosynthesis